MSDCAVLTLLQLAWLVTVAVAGPLCHECSRVPYPRDCDKVRRCGDHEVCHVEEIVSASGVVWYDTGCREKSHCGSLRHSRLTERKAGSDITVCDECCNTDFCNTQGCGFQGLPSLQTRGPVCFSCHQQHAPDTCDYVKMCSIDEECYLHLQADTIDPLYTSGCASAQQCHVLHMFPDVSLVGRREIREPVERSAGDQCFTCCRQDYCNTNCSSLHPTHLPLPGTTNQLHETSTAFQSSTPASTITVKSSLKTTVLTTHPSQSTIAAKFSTQTPKVTTAKPSTPIPEGSTTAKPSTKIFASSTAGTPSTYTTESTTSIPLETQPTAIPVSKAACTAAGYLYVDGLGLCYKVHQEVLMTWTGARSVCRREKGDLLVIPDAKTLHYIAAQHFYSMGPATADHFYWVGATDVGFEGIWRWVNGSEINSHNALFSPGEPNNMFVERGGENCGALSYLQGSLMMNDAICSDMSHFICQLSQPTLARHCVNSDFSYDPGLDRCYKNYFYDAKTWDAARSFCQAKHGDLLQLREKSEENLFSYQLLTNFIPHQGKTYFWIGGSDRAQEGVYRWLNNQPLGNLTWDMLEPNNFLGREDCLAYDIRLSPWPPMAGLNDIPCDSPIPFICQEICTMPGYSYNNQLGFCIKVYADLLTWPEARDQCFRDNADLAIVDTREKLQFLQTHHLHNDMSQYWIGAYDRLNTGHYTWVDSAINVPRDFWNPGEPSGGGEMCVAVAHAQSNMPLKLYDADCFGQRNKFICQQLW